MNINEIIIKGAREHNLKNVNLIIPRNKLIVMTGLSGSGKSSLAFDTIYAEGQRRYVESLSSYARQFLGQMEKRLAMVGLTLESVVQMDCLFRDVWNIPVMEKVIKERFNGKYPVRKSIQTEFAHVGGQDGLLFQIDGIAYSD